MTERRCRQRGCAGQSLGQLYLEYKPLTRDPDSRVPGRAQKTHVSEAPQVTLLYSLDREPLLKARFLVREETVPESHGCLFKILALPGL